MTPAQEAKAYAALHGFVIVANLRKYTVTREDSVIASVSSYSAALAAMIRYVEARAAIPTSRVGTRWQIAFKQPPILPWAAIVDGTVFLFATRADAIKHVRRFLSGVGGRGLVVNVEYRG